MHVRILGIAPLKTVTNEDGSFRDVTPVFWVYYPDLRPVFAKHEVYNGKNFGARMSWEELFESRMFASRIIKSTISNPNDEFIKSFIKDPILALLEGENVRKGSLITNRTFGLIKLNDNVLERHRSFTVPFLFYYRNYVTL